MIDTSPVVLGSLGDALPAGRNAVFAAARPHSAAPSFAPPFPLREVGVLFTREGAAPAERRTLPCFGLWSDVPPEVHAACAANVVVISAERNDRFVVELVAEEAETRLLLARTPRLATLGETIAPVVAAGRGGPSLWGRLTGKARFTTEDVLKVPPISIDVEGVCLRLAGGGGAIPTGERTRGRGEMYRRYLVCDGPFVVLLLSKTSGEVVLAAWIDDAAALA